MAYNPITKTYDTIAQMKAGGKPVVGTAAQINCISHSNYGDGGGGTFMWKDVATYGPRPAEDGGIVIHHITDVSGWFERNYSGRIDVRWFGVKGDSVADDTDAINKCFYAVGRIGGGVIYFPAGTYLVSATLFIRHSNIEVLLDKNAVVKNIKTTGPDYYFNGNNVYDVFRIAADNPNESLVNKNPLPEVTTINAPYAAGSTTIDVVDATDISIGDMIYIRSTEPLTASRRYYNKEYKTVVRGKNGNTLTIDPIPFDFNLFSDHIIPDQIWQSYAPAADKYFWEWRQYEIVEPSAGTENFTDIGAANNNVGTRFYASADSTAGAYTAGKVRVVCDIRVYKPKFISNIRISGGKIDGGLSRTTPGAMMIRPISCYFCTGVNVENITIENFTHYGLFCHNCVTIFGSNLIVKSEGAYNSTEGTWGVYFSACQDFLLSNCPAIKTLFSGIDCMPLCR